MHHLAVLRSSPCNIRLLVRCLRVHERAPKVMNAKKTKPTTTAEPEPWLDAEDSCAHLKISRPTLYRWINSKRLQPKRTPTGAFRFRRSDLDALLG